MTERAWSREDRWARHYQEAWEERAASPRLPNWLRVAALAYGSHRRNGHALFRPGEIAVVLGRLDEATGELVPSENVSRAIKVAVDEEWLAPGSTTRCLIVPSLAVAGGLGSEHAPCPVHSEAPLQRRERRLRAQAA